MRSCALAFVLVLVVASVTPAAPAGGGDRDPSFTGGVGLGVRTFDPAHGNPSTWYVMELPVAFRVGRFGVGLGAELAFDEEGRIRREDWDERSDWARLVRYLSYGAKGDRIYGRVGTLDDATLGHGTILGGFRSDVDYDHRKVGAQVDLDLGLVGVETVANNVVEPDVVGGRAYVRPLRTLPVPVLRNLAFGGTFVADIQAPKRLQLGTTGLPLLGEEGTHGVEANDVVFYGLDVEMPLVKNARIELTPYLDRNQAAGHGAGNHGGLLARVSVPALGDVRLRGEYGAFEDHYLPTYFDAFYETERFRYPELDSLTTKQQALEGQTGLEGWMAELRAALPRVVVVTADYADYHDAENGAVGARAAVVGLKGVLLTGTYRKRGVQNLADLGTLDDHTVVTWSLAYDVLPGLSAGFTFTRTWIYDEGLAQYKSLDTYTPGLFFLKSF